ncbi:MAG: nucleotide pyrophosphohydrolase [Candidatus Saccharimonadales bacterium]
MDDSQNKSLADMQVMIRKFCDDRNWDQFHNPKDLSISLSLEAAELLEHFQWKNEDEIHIHMEKHKDEVAAELADVFYWVLLMANKLEINLVEAFDHKMIKNEEKYAIDQSKGSHKKYTELNK